MSECPLFRYSLLAKDLTAKLQQESDFITCCYLAEQRLVGLRQMMGTQKGLVHVLNLVSGVGFTLENQHSIVDVHCGSQWLSYSSPTSIGVYDFENEREILDYPIEHGKWVRTLDQMTGSSNVLVATSEELFILQIGWVRTTKVLLAKVSSEIHSLAVAFPLLALANGTNVTVLKLPEGVQIYQQKNAGKVTIVWVSREQCAFVTQGGVRVMAVDVSAEEEYSLKEVVHWEVGYELSSVTSFQQQWMVVLSPDKTVRMVNLTGNVEFMEKIGMAGKLASEPTKENDAFYIVSQQEILKITTYSQTEKMNWYLDNGKYSEALVFGESVQYPREEIQSRILQDLVSKRQHTEAKEYLLSLIAAKSISWELVLKKYSSDQFLTQVCLDVPAEAMTVEAADGILKRLVADGREDTILKCFAVWPKRILFRNDLTKRELMGSSMVAAKIEYALRQGLLTVALQLLLARNSARIFDVIETDLQATKDFLKSLSSSDFLDFFKIDGEKSIRICVEHDWLDTDRVRECLPPDTAFDYLFALWHQKRRRNPGSDLVLLRMMLTRHSPSVLDLVTTSTGLNRLQALEVCREFGHIEGQIVLLQVLNRTSELIEVLKGNFEQGLNYLQRRDNEELWTAVISQGVGSEAQAKMLIPFLTRYKHQAQVVDRIPEGQYLCEFRKLLWIARQTVAMHELAFEDIRKRTNWHSEEAVGMRKKGVYVEKPYLCSICGKRMVGATTFRPCGHHSHKACSETSCRGCRRIRKLP